MHEYANRQWAGLIKRFYKPRWEQFFLYFGHKMIAGERMETTDFEQTIKEWEWQWVNRHDDHYTASPLGNLLEITKQLYKKYDAQIRQAYNN